MEQQLPRTSTTTRLHFKEIASPRTRLPRTSACRVENVIGLLLQLLLLFGLRSSLLDPERLSKVGPLQTLVFLDFAKKGRSRQTSPSLILASICDHPKLVI